MDEGSRVSRQIFLNKNVHSISLLATRFTLLHGAHQIIRAINKIVLPFYKALVFYHPIMYIAMIALCWFGKCSDITIFFEKVI